ncbi:hypothetical protein RJT34_28600 [Clitoria ternatea]|uniref:LYR motif containing domain-containing protein n=1 Tax=Clitoria ternatea TaxID=43366 RepID=A0AAN9IAD9_CLITE
MSTQLPILQELANKLCVVISTKLLCIAMFHQLLVWCCSEMGKGLIWATTEDLSRNRGRVLSLYREILRRLNSPELPLSFALRLAKKAEVRAMFWVGSEECSLHNIADLIDAAEYSLSFLRKGQLPPRYIT